MNKRDRNAKMHKEGMQTDKDLAESFFQLLLFRLFFRSVLISEGVVSVEPQLFRVYSFTSLFHYGLLNHAAQSWTLRIIFHLPNISKCKKTNWKNQVTLMSLVKRDSIKQSTTVQNHWWCSMLTRLYSWIWWIWVMKRFFHSNSTRELVRAAAHHSPSSDCSVKSPVLRSLFKNKASARATS